MKRNQLIVIITLAGILLGGCADLTTPSTVPGNQTQVTQPAATDPATTPASIPSTVPVTIPATIPVTIPSTTTPVATKSQAELDVEAWGARIYPGVTVGTIKVEGLTQSEAEAKLAETVERVMARQIPFTIYGKKYAPTQEQLGVSILYKKAVERAVQAYDALSVDEKAAILRDAPALNFKVTLRVDDEKLTAYIQKLADVTYRKATNELEGHSLLKKTLQTKLEGLFRFSSKTPDSFKASVKTTPRLSESADRVTIAKGTSKFAESDVERSKNIRVATKRLNGVVIQPGETLSVLRVIKAPTLANGYYMAKVYSGDTLIDGVGGGVCQVSSTLYNAVIRAGLKVTDRSTHRFSVFYLPYGMDATIFAPSTDFQFRNTLDYPITIKATAVKGTLTFSFISHPDAMNGYSYKFYQTDIVEGEKHWNIEYTDELAPGEEEILVYPHPKASAKVWRKTYLNDKLIKTEFWDQRSYRELVGVKRIGR